jgi:hypothetical protein
MGSVYRPKLKDWRTRPVNEQRSAVWWMKFYVNGRAARESTGTDDKEEAKRTLKRREGAAATGQPILPRIDPDPVRGGGRGLGASSRFCFRTCQAGGARANDGATSGRPGPRRARRPRCLGGFGTTSAGPPSGRRRAREGGHDHHRPPHSERLRPVPHRQPGRSAGGDPPAGGGRRARFRARSGGHA